MNRARTTQAAAHVPIAWLLFAAILVGCSKENNVEVGSNPNAHVGEVCTSEATCGDSVCVLGFCRPSCSSDSQCVDGNLCLAGGGKSGCRLATELSCATPGQPCPGSPSLVCALDKSCRAPCTGSCPVSGQQCIAGVCVGKDEPGASTTWFSCPTGRSCAGAKGSDIVSCNETSPGATVLATCENPGLCEMGKATGQCGAKVCTSGATRCEAAVVETCNSDGTSYEKTFGPCASQELCELSRGKSGATACIAPACAAADLRCRDGKAQRCSAALTEWEDAVVCSAPTAQCDPATGTCISVKVDVTEVTRDAYAGFLALATKPGAPAACAWNASYEPDAACMALPTVCQGGACGDHPQVCVDWCDAFAYCASQGKQLCGRLDGGVLGFDAWDDPARSAWMNACSSAGQHAFPYGDALVNASCKGGVFQPNTTVAAGSLASCQPQVPGYVGVFDLSGNAAEWDDACQKPSSETTAGPSDSCHVRGGSYLSQNAELACAASRTFLRSQTSPEVGFRCCSP